MRVDLVNLPVFFSASGVDPSVVVDGEGVGESGAPSGIEDTLSVSSDAASWLGKVMSDILLNLFGEPTFRKSTLEGSAW